MCPVSQGKLRKRHNTQEKNRTCAGVCLASGASFLLAHQLFLCVALAVFLGPHQGPLGAASGLGIVSSRNDDRHGHEHSTTLKGQKNTRTQDMYLKFIFDFEAAATSIHRLGVLRLYNANTRMTDSASAGTPPPFAYSFIKAKRGAMPATHISKENGCLQRRHPVPAH